MSLPELNPAGIALRSRQRADMVGSSFVTESEVRGYNNEAFQEYLGIIASRYSELLLRRGYVTAFAGEDTVSLGAQCPRTSAGWVAYQGAMGSASYLAPDGSSSVATFLCATGPGTSWLSIPMSNLEFEGSAPNVTFELVARGDTSSDIYAYFEVVAAQAADDPAAIDLAKQCWVNLTTGAIGTVGSSLRVQVRNYDTSDSQLYRTWKRIRISFKAIGPRHTVRLAVVVNNGVGTRDTTNAIQIASARALQATPMKKLSGVRVANGPFLRRKSLRDLEQYANGQVGRNTPDGYVLKADNGATENVELVLMPTPNANTTLEYWYMPVFSLEDAGALALVASWDQFVVVSSAIKMLMKEETDVRGLLAEKESLRAQIIADLDPVDASEPPRVVRLETSDLRADPDEVF